MRSHVPICLPIYLHTHVVVEESAWDSGKNDGTPKVRSFYLTMNSCDGPCRIPIFQPGITHNPQISCPQNCHISQFWLIMTHQNHGIWITINELTDTCRYNQLIIIEYITHSPVTICNSHHYQLVYTTVIFNNQWHLIVLNHDGTQWLLLYMVPVSLDTSFRIPDYMHL